MEIAMPMEAGKLVLLQLGVRYELVFFSRESLYRTVGQVKERYKKDNIYMLEMELKSQPEKFQRREYFRYPCLLDFKYYELTAEQAMLDSVDAIFSEIRDEHFYEKERKGKIMDLKWRRNPFYNRTGTETGFLDSGRAETEKPDNG